MSMEVRVEKCGKNDHFDYSKEHLQPWSVALWSMQAVNCRTVRSPPVVISCAPPAHIVSEQMLVMWSSNVCTHAALGSEAGRLVALPAAPPAAAGRGGAAFRAMEPPRMSQTFTVESLDPVIAQ